MHLAARRHRLTGTLLLACLLLLAGCRQDVPVIEPGAAHPAQAIAALNAHLVNNDLAAFARAAIPSALYSRVEAAWTARQTRWPLDEFPFAEYHPQLLALLAADGARDDLLDKFEQTLAGDERGLAGAALFMSIFLTQTVQSEGDFSASERAHYAQLLLALGKWGAAAPLADHAHAEAALDLLIPAARTTNLGSDTAFAEAGMEDALHRLAPMVRAVKEVFARYGLDLDALLTGMEFKLLQQEGNAAEVEMRYRLLEYTITATIPVEQIDGRWYVSDFVRHARAAGAQMPEDDTLPAADQV